MPSTISLSDYAPKKLRATLVLKLDVAARSSPIDINLGAIIQESSRNLSDRLRFWHTLTGIVPHNRLTIRKLDLDEQAVVHCQIEIDGLLSILSDDREYTTRFFRAVFLNSRPVSLVLAVGKLEGFGLRTKPP